MLGQKRTQTEQKYIAAVLLRTSAIVAVWFGLTGLALNLLSDRVSLHCERDAESVAECKLGVNRLFSQSQIDLSQQKIRQVSNRSISNEYLPTFVRWQLEIMTDRERLEFNSYGVARDNRWEYFADRTNKFIKTPQLRTLTVTSEYSFWFKFLSQAVSGISILYGLFIVPSLYLIIKYGDDPIAHQQAFDRVFGGITGQNKSPNATIDRPQS
jgi:hypothetical protein